MFVSVIKTLSIIFRLNEIDHPTTSSVAVLFKLASNFVM